MQQFLFSMIQRGAGFCFMVFLLCILGSIFPKASDVIFETDYNSVAFLSECLTQNDSVPIDILVLGSSIGQRGIDPEIIGSKESNCFNLCSNGQSTLNSMLILEWALRQGISPNFVLLDLYPGIGQSNGIESARGMASSIQQSFIGPAILSGIFTGDPYSIILWMAASTQLLFDEQQTLEFGADQPKSNGFIASHREPNKDEPFPCHEKFEARSWKQQKALDRIQNLCAEHQIKLIVINPPQLCEERFEPPNLISNSTWINGNEWPEAKNPTLYYDDHHLIAKGAEYYSVWLASQLKPNTDSTHALQ